MTILLMTVSFCVMADDNGYPEPVFSQAAEWDNFSYDYVSPYMLKCLRQSNTKQNFISGLDISKIDMIEMVTTPWEGQNSKINSLISKVIKLPGMQKLMRSQKDNQSVECYGMPKGKNSDQMKQILIVKRSGWGSHLTVIYLIGEITVSELYNLLD